MEIVNKNNIPSSIVDDDYRFNETVCLLLRNGSLSVHDIAKVYESYHKELDYIDFYHQYIAFKKDYDNFTHHNYKLMRHPFVRKYSSYLKQEMKSGMSHKQTEKMLSSTINEIIQEVGFITATNYYHQGIMEQFIETLEKEHLQSEFHTMIKTFYKGMEMSFNNNQHVAEKVYDRSYLYKLAHARYLVELNSTNPSLENLAQIKDDIHHILALSDEQAIKKASALYSERGKKDDEISIVLKDQTIIADANNRGIKQAYKFVIESGDMKDNRNIYGHKKTKALSLSVNENVREYDNGVIHQLSLTEDQLKSNLGVNLADTLQTVLEHQIDDDISKKIKEYFKKYYDYNQQGDESDLFSLYFKLTYSFNSYYKYQMTAHEVNNFTSILTYSYVSYFKLALKGIDEMSDEKKENITHDGFYFLCHFLAYHLWIKSDERLEGFKAIVKKYDECQDSYNYYRDHRDAFPCFYPPEESDNNFLVLAVLFECDKQAIRNKLKKLITIDDTYQDLSHFSLEMHKLYDQDKDYSTENICHYADLLVLSFLKDKNYLVCFTPFIRLIYHIFHCFDYSQDIENDKIEQDYEEMMETEGQYASPCFDYLRSILLDSHKLCYSDDEKTSDQDKQAFIHYIQAHDDFFKQSKEKQIDQFKSATLLYHLIDQIDKLNKYLPDSHSEKKLNEIDSYIEENKALKQQVKDLKAKQKEELSSMHFYYQNKIEKERRSLEKQIKSDKHEMVLLNKKIKEKEEEMEPLINQQQELFKLRELMFSMKEDIPYHDEEVDLKGIIKNKTIVLIGPQSELIERFKKKYPTIKCINGKMKYNEDLISYADYVFLFYEFLSHSCYYQMINTLTKKHIPFDYIPNISIEKTEKLIYDLLKASF